MEDHGAVGRCRHPGCDNPVAPDELWNPVLCRGHASGLGVILCAMCGGPVADHGWDEMPCPGEAR